MSERVEQVKCGCKVIDRPGSNLNGLISFCPRHCEVHVAELERELAEANESRRVLRIAANCGGPESQEYCCAEEEPNHKIFGPYVGIGNGLYLCEFHWFKKQIIDLQQQLSTARAEERDTFKEIVNGWLEAYPEDIFIPPTKDQIQIAQKALQAIGMTVDKFSANMARHMAKRLLEQIDEAATIRNLK